MELVRVLWIQDLMFLVRPYPFGFAKSPSLYWEELWMRFSRSSWIWLTLLQLEMRIPEIDMIMKTIFVFIPSIHPFLLILDDRCFSQPGVILEHIHHRMCAVCKADSGHTIKGIKTEPVLSTLRSLTHL